MDQSAQPINPSTPAASGTTPPADTATQTPAPVAPAAPTPAPEQPAPAAPAPTPEPIPTPATPPTTPPAPVTPTATAAGAPPAQPTKKKGMNMWVGLLIIVLVALLGGAAYFLAKTQLSGQKVTQMPTPVPVRKTAITPLPTAPVASPTAMISGENVGSVSGTLCYPGSVIPAGTIYAKDTTTMKESTQAYKGTQAGGGTTYTMQLAAGTYHMKFVPTQNSTVIGYYTEYSTCVDNPSEPNCTGQKTRAILPVTIKTGQTMPKVNLCDYYYTAATPPQY